MSLLSTHQNITSEPTKLLVDWSAVLWSGITTAALSLPILFFALPGLLGIDTNNIIQYWSAMLLGAQVITVPSDFSVVLFFTAIISHLAIALVLSTVIASIFHRFGILVGITGGALVGLAYYFINIYSMTYFFNWMYFLEGPVFMLFNMLLGGMAGFFYESLEIEQWEDPKDYNSSMSLNY
ncbi:hypothetical protein [Kangiella sp. HZ709]|uniref:hypothetical protein n=1 Tax=Kangiella sp. HZ709 TaxID=2666328 RepID=UPI0012B06450|nr:hypothetical protein [Kangiella sp. HZ709]MRX27220.1 hypothetical protein [Kangiella sp. HZ709]